MTRRFAVLFLLLAAVLSGLALTPPAGAGNGERAVTLELEEGARAYLPASRPDAGASVLVLLHGYGGSPHEIIGVLRREAERCGIILLAPKAGGHGWDWFEALAQDRTARFAQAAGRDSARIDRALAALGEQVAVDPARIGIGGFSDGAGYALSLGLAQPERYSTILAFSAGAVDPPSRVAKAQRVFIAHGRSDRILDFDYTASGIVPLLEGTLTLKFRPFDGGHTIPRGVREDGMAYFAAPYGGCQGEG